MDGKSIGRTSNTQSLSSMPANSDPLSNFAKQIFCLSKPFQRLLNTDTADRYVTDSGTQCASSVDSVFGSVPTRNEVEHAVAAFQSFMQRLSPGKAQNQLHDQRIQQSPGLQKVYDAFLLLKTAPYVQRMVVSISSDKAVWNAIMKNNEVQDFQKSLNQARRCRLPGSDGADENVDLVAMILLWIADNMKHTVMGLIERLKSMALKRFEHSKEEENTGEESKHDLQELICTAVMLSTLTMIIVLVTRA